MRYDHILYVNTLESRISWSGSEPASVVRHTTGWIAATWEARAGTAFAATCRMAIPNVMEPFWCVPGLFWGDNQQDRTGQYYPRFHAKRLVPQRFESAYWEFHTHRMAQPLCAVHDGLQWWTLEVEPFVKTGRTILHASVGFEFENGCATLIASLPFAEQPYQHLGHDYTMPRRSDWVSDADVQITWRIRSSAIPGTRSALLDHLQHNYHKQSAPSKKADLSECAAATRDALMHWHFHPEESYFRYTVAFDRVGQQLAEAGGSSLDRHEMGVGWVNGWVVFEALIEWAIRNRDEFAMAAVNTTWSNLTGRGIVSPSGFWWTRFSPQRHKHPSIFDARRPDGWDANWMPNPEHLHLRTVGDAVLRAARVLRRHAATLNFANDLNEQLLHQASAVAALAREGWPLPMSIDALSGRPAGLNGTAGMIWISVWCELWRTGAWSDLSIIAAGLDYYRDSVMSGDLYGAPEDVGECVTSEDIYIAINTFLDGYRVTGRQEDLDTAAHAARWLYLWRKSFDHAMDPLTILGVYQLRSRGGDLASAKNNHLHIYGLDADTSLRELAKITGDSRWRELADDHWEFAAQLTPLVDGQFNAYRGMVTEQFYFIDWSALGNSVHLFEKDELRSAYDVGPHYRNNGNLAGFSHAWCTAFVLTTALDRQSSNQP